jgi:hypothetical protein
VATTAEWRSYGEFDVVLILEDGVVKEALTADAEVLHDFLAVLLPNVAAWEGDHAVEGDRLNPAAWGTLVMSRDTSGDITDMDPELFWAGVGIWFRSHGVDYNTPRPQATHAD